jgi:hypothetical protein
LAVLRSPLPIVVLLILLTCFVEFACADNAAQDREC